MLLGAIADDFTGASDLANTLKKGGMATTLFVDTNAADVQSECEAGVVALKSRSIEVDGAVAQSITAARWLLSHGCKQIVFKYCSTFDSTPNGNIGPVAEALLDLLGAQFAVVCPAFPETGRSVFMGHLFVGDRLLNESGLQDHPLNPMPDPDIRRWLGRQITGNVGFVSHNVVRRGGAQLISAFEDEAAKGHRLVVVDAINEGDLHRLGKAVAGHKLVTGASGIALGLPNNLIEPDRAVGKTSAAQDVRGPAVVLSGSCSPASLAQVAEYLNAHPGFAIDPDRLVAGDLAVNEVADWAWQRIDEAPLIYSTADPASVAAAQAEHDPHELASLIEHFMGALAIRLTTHGVRRLVVAGGETSGAVVEALGIGNFEIGAEIDPGVPVMKGQIGGSAFGLALKSGNFGTQQFFEKALTFIGTAWPESGAEIQ
ncbi:3-oxo-tetronate kinase [Labrenzia sp. DG1229]|uniref:3-oxo-tetronate kinase n=1 Tax=Labrenzia sp. DG1229 TaxID=681847 RepID=UPI00048D527A|nr:3-oxo-tetronate kinase [Labrenzia sp. DG1229]